MQSCIVTCSAAEDVKYRRYPNLSKNMIKIKCSSVFSTRLLVLLASCPHFCLGGSVGLTVGLTVGLAINGALFIVRKVAGDLSE